MKQCFNGFKIFLICGFFSFTTLSFSQHDDRISTMDFVQILNDNRAEVVHYYENNWKILREMAIEKDYILSYEILELSEEPDQPFQIILITTYTNQGQYDLREEHFQELIKEKGGLDLLNEKKPDEFRKTFFTKELVRHWN